MGAGIVLVVWLMAAAAYFGVFAVLAIFFFLARKRKWKWTALFTGIPAAAMGVVAILLLGFMGWGLIRSTQPSWVFQQTFNRPPSQGISEIKSDLYWFADTGSVYLRFKVGEEEFLKLIPEGLSKRTKTEIEKGLPSELGSEPPNWWTFRFDDDWVYFWRDDFMKHSPSKKGFYSETEYFAYDRRNNTAYYRFLGID